MDEPLNYKVNGKEKTYFIIKIFATLIVIAGIVMLFNVSTRVSAMVGVCAAYALIIGLFLMIRKGLLIGYLRGSCVRISPEQFPDINKIFEQHCKKLGLTKIPSLYILQSGEILNAFATRFIGSNYVVLLSGVLEAAYTEGRDAVSFIVGHELGHVKRNHASKNFWLFPSMLVPFLQGAYSRACEYTCDSIGHALSPSGATQGMLILSVGKDLYKWVNVRNYLEDSSTRGGFWVWFSEVLSSHPFFPKRIGQFADINQFQTSSQKPFGSVMLAESKRDYSEYQPKTIGSSEYLKDPYVDNN
jgi:Zn-dependent protease with chaperone function